MHELYYKQKNFNTFTRWCFDEIIIPAYVHAVRSCFDGEGFRRTRYAKAPYSKAFFPFRPKDGCSSIVELVNDILFDIPSLVARCWPSTNGKYRSHD